MGGLTSPVVLLVCSVVGLKMFVLNTEYYGQMMPTADSFGTVQDEANHYEGFKQQFLGRCFLGCETVGCVLNEFISVFQLFPSSHIVCLVEVVILF